MSSVISGDLESSNPFDELSDYPIFHILSYLPGADLVKLSEMNQNFKRIITESRETMRRIPLVLDFNKDLDLEDAIILSQSRRFTSLRLKSVKLTDAKAKVKFSTLLDMLSGSVDDLIVSGNISRDLLSSIIASFLPKLKKCKLYGVTIEAEAGAIIEEISHQNNINHPLQSLELIDAHALEVLKLFAGCNQLKTFCYSFNPVASDYSITIEDVEHVNNFLATQDRLETLVHSAGLAWNRLSCFKLKELTADCMWDNVDEIAAAEFLEKLPKLTELNIGIIDHPSRRLMKAICRIPKLEKLSVQSCIDGDDYEDEDENEDEYEDTLKGLVNRTVKQLQLVNYSGQEAKLQKFFEVFESAWICVINEDPYDVNNRYFHFKFSPRIVPTDAELFQSRVTKLTKKYSYNCTAVEIGHANWRKNGAFRLSNSFCEDLVNRLPKLRKLEIYNIADRGSFFSFLVKNEDRLSLEDVKIHEPFGVDEAKPRKMTIQAD